MGETDAERMARAALEGRRGVWEQEYAEAAARAAAPPVEPFTGPDCGIDGCAREVGHIGDHRPAPDRAAERPEIVVLCGSTRFYDEFQAANYDLTMLGKIVLSVGFYPHAKAMHGHGEGVGHDSAEKIALDELHKRKIDLADRVYVINIGGYIGESTRSEIDYAIAQGKPIDYWEKP